MAVGGLAARAWGGTRDLVDLDFYVPQALLPKLADAAPGGAAAPVRVRGDQWDLTVLACDLAGCRVEFAAAEDARLRNARTGLWQSAAIDFGCAVTREVLGVRIPVMPRADLIAYKTALDRDVDAVDLYEITGAGGAVDTRLAVYGTLAPGEVNHAQLASVRGSWSRGTIRGHVHPVGWGMTHGFPALAWDPEGPALAAHLFESPDLPGHWERLDAFEGPAYRRLVLPVHTNRGRLLANAYVVRWPA